MSQEEKPEEARLIAAMIRTLQVGAEKFNNLFFYAPRNAGKSCAIDPATYIFGAKLTYTRPAGKCNFPLQGIANKKVAALQDLRPQSMRNGWDSLLVLLEGQRRRAHASKRELRGCDVVCKGHAFLHQRV